MIKLKADGSGTIEQRLLLTDAATDQLKAFAILGGGNTASADPTSEAQARSLAESIGPGVTYVSSTPVKTARGQGRDSVYAFTDITQLHVSEQPRVPGGVSLGPQNQNGGQITFALTRQPDGNALLRILIPRPDGLPIAIPGQRRRHGAVDPADRDGQGAARRRAYQRRAGTRRHAGPDDEPVCGR